MKLLRRGLLLFALFTLLRAVTAAELADDFRTVATAIKAEVNPATVSEIKPAGYLGVSTGRDKRGHLVVTAVGTGSPAETAGVLVGDVLLKLDRDSVSTSEDVREHVQQKAAGDAVSISLQRGRKKQQLTAVLAAISKPMRLPEERAIMGLRVGTPPESGGIPVTFVTPDKPAAKAGLKRDDVILRVDGVPIGEGLSLTERLAEFKPGDKVTVSTRRGAEEFEKVIELEADESSAVPPEERRVLKPWKKDVYRLAVLLVEFPDAKHNEAIGTNDWADAYFSSGTYTNVNVTGQKVFGSMADYYREISCGQLKVEGRVFDWVEMPKKRGEYNIGRSTTVRLGFFNAIVAAIQKRDGRNALKGFDGLAVIYAGERYPGANRGSMFWPHRSSVLVNLKSWPYVIVAEGGKRMSSISTMCHETGHILGLPDLYARPENPGSEGVGSWCAMSNQSPNGRPQHFSAWCKEQLGWLTPTVIDPSVKQRLVLSPIEGSTNECFKVLVRPDGAEYFLLENRRKQGFDASLSAEGLLIWRVVANRPILEEAHGVTGPTGPRAYLSSVPFPSKANTAFTPFTTPSSKPQLAGGKTVCISNIQQLPDGRVTFQIGYEFD